MKSLLRIMMVLGFVTAVIPSTVRADCLYCNAAPPYYVGFCAWAPMGFTQCTEWAFTCMNEGEMCFTDDEDELLPSGQLVSSGKEVTPQSELTLGATATEVLGPLEASSEKLWASSDAGEQQYFVKRDCRGLIRERVGVWDAALDLRQAID